MTNYDVVVIGGAMIGSAAALQLAGQGRRVALIETRVANNNLDDGAIDLRVSAVSHASRALLEQLGAWQKLDPEKISPYREMQVWDAEIPPQSDQVLNFDCADIGAADLGHIIENRRIVAALHRCIARQAIEFLMPASVEEISEADDYHEVRLADGRRLRTRLIVAADGAGSKSRERAGFETTGWSYEQKAVVTHVTTARPHGETAYQRFLPDGPIALLPLYDGRSSVVWSTTPQRADSLLDMGADEFNAQLQQATDGVLGDIVASDRRAAFPLQLLHAVSYVKRGLLLLGDAAHAVHPLAGQGANLGFADVSTLGAILNGVPSDQIGDLSVLRRYERQRKSENLLMMGALDALHRLFRQQSPWLSRGRQLGMTLFNRMTPLKHAVIRRALGH